MKIYELLLIRYLVKQWLQIFSRNFSETTKIQGFS